MSYYDRHCACPKCERVYIEKTTDGVIYNPDKEYVDNNLAKCPCGWIGTVHDLIEYPNE